MGDGGEVVTGINYLYHSLDLMAPSVSQDLDMSIEQLESTRAKTFQDLERNRSVIVLLTPNKPQDKSNLALLVDQSELCVNIIANSVI